MSVFQPGIEDNLAIIDRAGDPLSFVITAANFPEVQEATLRKTAQVIEDAREMYYNSNTITGCGDVSAPGFNFQANNPDNDACVVNSNSTASFLDRSFGGIYQTCSISRGREPLCVGQTQANSLTNGFNSPPGYQDILLNEGSQSVTMQYSRVDEECTFFFFCDDVVRYFYETTVVATRDINEHNLF